MQSVKSTAVRISTEGAILDGDLSLPAAAQGCVLFAHGSGSSRHSPRNQFVASELQKANMATLLFDLLTGEEEQLDLRTGHLRFNIELLAERLVAATDWLQAQPAYQQLPLGYFGASTGGGAAIVAAAERPSIIKAAVSRGGRPDLAGDSLERIEAPTLLLVGGNDFQVIELNQLAMQRMNCTRVLRLIPHATHLFEEPGTLEQVALHAVNWFKQYLVE